MKVPQDKLLYEPAGLGHLLFGGGDGNIVFGGDGIIRPAFAAREVDLPSGWGQTVDGGYQQLLILSVLQAVVGVVDRGGGAVREKIGQCGLFNRLSFETVVDLVTGEDEQVVFKRVDGWEALPFLPDLQEYLLHHLSCFCFVPEIYHGSIEYFGGVIVI